MIDVLHASGECRFCDDYPELQRARKEQCINFTGYEDPAKLTCPEEVRRPLGVINLWNSNVPSKLKEK